MLAIMEGGKIKNIVRSGYKSMGVGVMFEDRDNKRKRVANEWLVSCEKQ